MTGIIEALSAPHAANPLPLLQLWMQQSMPYHELARLNLASQLMRAGQVDAPGAMRSAQKLQGIGLPLPGIVSRLPAGVLSQEQDMLRQMLFLERQSQRAGFGGVDKMLAEQPQSFMRLAEKWRERHPLP